MPGEFEIALFLRTHRAEVVGMLLTEYDEAQQMELFREEGREEGRVQGREEGRAGSVATLMETMHVTAQAAMDMLRVPEGERSSLLALL